MKIGIITFHSAYNYGAVLQAYALQAYLLSLGHSVQIVDYWPDSLCRHYRIFPMPDLRGLPFLRKIKRIVGWGGRLPRQILLSLPRARRRKRFLQFFANHFSLTERIYADRCTLLNDFDVLFFGSDQIWNTQMIEGHDPVFLGCFQSKARKIAYAASAGAMSDEVVKDANFINAVSVFHRISVREKNFADALGRVLQKTIPVVLDPTLLQTAAVWDRFLCPVDGKKKYVLVYEVLPIDGIDSIADGLAMQLDADVIRLWSGFSQKHIVDSSCNRMHVSPGEFVSLFRHASCVVTSSFHGTAFSLIFHRPFYYVGNRSKAENRPRQIIDALQLSERIVSDGVTPEFSEIDYSRANELLAELQASSRDFIADALKVNAE